MIRRHQRIRPALVGLALTIGLGAVAPGCGDNAAPAPGNEPVPEGFAKAKEAMKGRAAAKAAPGRKRGR